MEQAKPAQAKPDQAKPKPKLFELASHTAVSVPERCQDLLSPQFVITRGMLISILATTMDIVFCDDNDDATKNVSQNKQKDTKEKTGVEAKKSVHPESLAFTCLTRPNIDLDYFMKRIAEETYISNEALIFSIVNLSQLMEMVPTFPINIFTIHRLLLISMMVSAKYFDDHYVNNAVYARAGGIPIKELNQLEVTFMFLLQFKLYLDEVTYGNIFKELVIENPNMDLIIHKLQQKNETQQRETLLVITKKEDVEQQAQEKQKEIMQPMSDD